MKSKLKKILPIVDFFLIPVVFVSASILKIIRKYGIKYFPFSRKIFASVGVFPIRDHYYEPLFNSKYLTKPLFNERKLPGIDWNVEEQVTILNSFSFREEFKEMPDNYVSDIQFHFKNGAFESGDAEYWYNLIRLKKPKTIIEIGSGHSTKMARMAITMNESNDAMYKCNHVCIEPYEMPWLEKLGIEVIRKKVEDMEPEFFRKLEANDILFIDSSHMIRPQGDVLFEYLELIPTLKPGVIVHIHDIFSPRDYLSEWIIDEMRFWNEQYLLESFLSHNNDWKIIGALNLLKHNHFELLKDKCPRLTKEREPGSFYMVRR